MFTEYVCIFLSSFQRTSLGSNYVEKHYILMFLFFKCSLTLKLYIIVFVSHCFSLFVLCHLQNLNSSMKKTDNLFCEQFNMLESINFFTYPCNNTINNKSGIYDTANDGFNLQQHYSPQTVSFLQVCRVKFMKLF